MFKKIMAFMLLGFFALTPVFAGQTGTAKQNEAQTLQSVKHSDVCMVQNRHGIMKMIPVEINGKMYYGCCAGCVGKLKFNPAVRLALDPVTGKQVDKSAAFIVGNRDGTVIYFESRETAEKFFDSKKSL